VSGAAFRPHVLVVSDDPDLSAFLAEGLTYGGFWASVVASAIQVLEVFRLRGFDLVLVDGGLAGLGALELVRRLRGRGDRAAPGVARTDVPLWLVLDRPDAMPDDALAAGADGVLIPPLDLDELAPRLHAIIAVWRAAHPDRLSADELAQRRPSGDGWDESGA